MPERLIEELWDKWERLERHRRWLRRTLPWLLIIMLVCGIAALAVRIPVLRLCLALLGLAVGLWAVVAVLIRTRLDLDEALLRGKRGDGGEECALLATQDSGSEGDELPAPNEDALRFRFQPDRVLPLLVALEQRDPDGSLFWKTLGRFQVELVGRCLFDRPYFSVLGFLSQASKWQADGGIEELGSAQMDGDPTETPAFRFWPAPDGWHFASTFQLAEPTRPIGAAELRAALDALRQDLRAMSCLRPVPPPAGDTPPPTE